MNYFLVSVAFLLLSCNPKYYTPNTHNVPLLTTKGETHLNVSGNASQVEFQAAHGITSHIAIKANGGLFIPKDLENGNGGSGRFLELGGGYYAPLLNNFVLETYVIAGFGSFENHLPSTRVDYPMTMGDISANIMRIGLQPNLGYKTKYYEIALSGRFVNLSYRNISGDLIFDGRSQTDYLKENESSFLIEPALTFRFGLEKLKVQIQYGYSFNASNPDFKQDHSFLTMGANVTFK